MESSPPNSTASDTVCATWLSPAASSQYSCLVITTLSSVRANGRLSLMTHFCPHSDLTGRGDPQANEELPFARYGDTQNCFLTFAFDKKLLCNLLTPSCWSPPQPWEYLPTGMEISWEQDVNFLYFSCVLICHLALQIQSAKSAFLCPLTGGFTASNNFLRTS